MRGVRQRVRQQAGRVRRRVARGAVMALGTTALVAALSSPAAGASDTVVATGLIDDQPVGREIGDPDNGDGGGEGAGHFVDDDGSDYESALDALDAAGVFVDTKCGVDRICPDETVKRWVAAVWLGRVLPDITPEASAPSPFEDVDVAEWWLPYVIHLASLDILPGCQGSDESEGGVADNYCPDDDITRSQVASALAAAFELEPSGRAGLTDISDRGDADDIDAVVSAGIAEGCGTDPRRYCPDDTISRGEMATFLARALGLVPLSPWVRFSSVAAGGEHACGLRIDGTVTCWGTNSDGQADAPVGRFVSVSAGGSHSCAVRSDQTVVCWGNRDSSQAAAPVGRFVSVSAGGDHTCGLRVDGTVTCWGANWAGQAHAPGGRFRAVATGGIHSCGLRVDGTVTCWGYGDDGQTNSPSGEFVELSLGYSHSCGRRADSTISCWGTDGHGNPVAVIGKFNSLTTSLSIGQVHWCGMRADRTVACWGYDLGGETDAPDGRFITVTAGTTHSCGLRTDETIACWGSMGDDRASPPGGQFIMLAAGNSHSCGLGGDETIACWGDSRDGQATPPDGRFSAIVAGARHSCGLRTDGTIACWGSDRRLQASPPEGTFRELTAGDYHSCAIGVDETVSCWGANTAGETDSPAGRFSRLAAGSWYSCGLRADGAIACWGDNSDGQTDAPEGAFRHLTAGDYHSCAIGVDETVSCWGANWDGQTDSPAGRFSRLAVGDSHSCGLRANGAIACWGANWNGETDAPRGPFRELTAGGNHSCAIGVDETVSCWGANWDGQTDSPAGRFSRLAVGDSHSCGLRTDGTIACWGVAYVAPPLGARPVTNGAGPPGRRVAVPPLSVRRVTGPNPPDPESCKPYGPHPAVVTAGFPLPSWAPAATTVRVAVLFVDFPDAEAAYSTQVEADLGLPYAERYLEAAGYGRFDLQFVPLHRWLRAEHGYDHYAGGRSVFGLIDMDSALDAEAVRLADNHFDFTGIDLLMVVAPSTHFVGGNAGGQATTDEGVLPTVRANTARDENAEGWGPSDWGGLAAHELLHGLGLVDLYDTDSSPHSWPDAPEGKAWIGAGFGAMGLGGRFLVGETDPVVSPVWRYTSDLSPRLPFGAKLSLIGWEILAWSRWQLGWLDAERIRCVDPSRLDDGTELTVTLSPVAAAGGDLAMAAIPLSDTEVIVIESRRRTGYDDFSPENYLAHPAERVMPFPAEGILVYTVDASVGTGNLPLKLAGDTGDGQLDGYPLLAQGDGVTVRGYRIAVVSDDGDTHTVTISRRPEE